MNPDWLFYNATFLSSSTQQKLQIPQAPEEGAQTKGPSCARTIHVPVQNTEHTFAFVAVDIMLSQLYVSDYD